MVERDTVLALDDDEFILIAIRRAWSKRLKEYGIQLETFTKEDDIKKRILEIADRVLLVISDGRINGEVVGHEVTELAYKSGIPHVVLHSGEMHVFEDDKSFNPPGPVLKVRKSEKSCDEIVTILNIAA